MLVHCQKLDDETGFMEGQRGGGTAERAVLNALLSSAHEDSVCMCVHSIHVHLGYVYVCT